MKSPSDDAHTTPQITGDADAILMRGMAFFAALLVLLGALSFAAH